MLMLRKDLKLLTSSKCEKFSVLSMQLRQDPFSMTVLEVSRLVVLWTCYKHI